MHDSSPSKGRRNATKFGLLERDLKKSAVRLRSPKKLSDEFHKRLKNVDMTPTFHFGKCFA